MWKTIKNYPNYAVSDVGQIKNIKKNKFIKGIFDSDGYLVVCLYDINKERKLFKIHRLVALAFITNPLNLSQINHLNGIKVDNCVLNLEWFNSQRNIQHAYKIGLNKHFTKPVILETETEIIEFESIKLCAEYLNISCELVSWYLKNISKKHKYKIYYKEE